MKNEENKGTKPLPAILYKYRPIDREGKLERLIIEGRCWFSALESLNDPFEFKAQENYTLKFSRYLKDTHRVLSPLKGRTSPANRLKMGYELARQGFTRNRGKINKNLNDNVGVFCLSEDPLSHLMWSHYSDGHRGVCVGFDTRGWLFPYARAVNYSDKTPLVSQEDYESESPSTFFEKTSLFKSKHWEYEREWRILSYPMWPWRKIGMHNMPADVRYMNGPGEHQMPPQHICSVYFGLASSQQDIELVMQWIAQSGSSIDIYRLIADPKNYGLTPLEIGRS